MREQMQARLAVLKTELATGTAKLGELELQQMRLREVLLRLRGAIQVLEELLGQAKLEVRAPQRDSPAAQGDSKQEVDPKEVDPKQEGRPGTEGGGPP